MLVDNFSIDIRKGGDWEKRDVCGDIHQVCQRAGCFSGYSGGYGENGQTAEGTDGGFLYDKPWEKPGGNTVCGGGGQGNVQAEKQLSGQGMNGIGLSDL